MRQHGQDLTISRMTVDGRTVQLALTGGQVAGKLTGTIKAALSDLRRPRPPPSSATSRPPSISLGTQTDLAMTAHAQGDIGAPGVPRGPVTVDIAAKACPPPPPAPSKPRALSPARPSNSPSTPSATQTAPSKPRSTAPTGAACTPTAQSSSRAAPSCRSVMFSSAWASWATSAPSWVRRFSGALMRRWTSCRRRSAFKPMPPTPASPAPASAQRRSTPACTTRLAPRASPPAPPSRGSTPRGVTGSAKIDVTGPQSALAIRTDAALTLSGTPAQINGAALLDVPGKSVRLNTLQVAAKSQTARLLAPPPCASAARSPSTASGSACKRRARRRRPAFPALRCHRHRPRSR